MKTSKKTPKKHYPVKKEERMELVPSEAAPAPKNKLKLLQLVKYPAESLFIPSRKINLPEEGDEMMKLAKDMIFTMTFLPWGTPLGLAAPQVGENVCMFVAQGRIYLNPRIVWVTKAPVEQCLEGCYSLEEKRFDYKTERYQCIRLEWQDFLGEIHEARFNGKAAQVIQHELDHLEGRLCGQDPVQAKAEREMHDLEAIEQAKKDHEVGK